MINKCGNGEVIENDCVYDDKIFLFTLHNNKDNRIQKFEQKERVSTMIYDNNKFYICGGGSMKRFYVSYIGSSSCKMKGISKIFNGTNGMELIGYNCDDDVIPFTVNRLIVIEMK